MKRLKAHPPYELADGTRVAGTTTITGMMAKPFLITWANRLGLGEITGFPTKVTKYVDELADIGTLAHYLIECELKGEEPDTSDFTTNQMTLAHRCVKKFAQWKQENPSFKPIEVELSLVSEEYRFGGTCDIYCTLNGVKTLIDLKTGRSIYPEHYVQVSAYKKLLEENGHIVDDVRILKIGRDSTEGFEYKAVPAIEKQWKKFLYCLGLYNLNKELKEV